MSTVGALLTETFTETTLKTSGRGWGLGDRHVDHQGKEYVFVQADGAVTGAGYVCVIDENYQAAMISTSNDANGDIVGVALAAFADNEYGWLQIKGPISAIRVAASAAANAPLMATATAGQLDDGGAQPKIAGIALTTANGGSAATAAGILNYPVVTDVAGAA